MTKTTEIKAAELVLDYNLYPRHKIDSTHVQHLRSAIRAGEDLGPVRFDQASRRVIDGFHRVTANLKEYGKDAAIKGEAREYDSEAAMFLDAIALNTAHGANLQPYDRVRCITVAEELKIAASNLADALRMPADEVAGMRVKRTATTKGRSITPIKQGLSHLAGKKLTKKQERGNESYGGLRPLFYVNQVALVVENGLLDRRNANLIGRLAFLRDLLNEVDLSVHEEGVA